MPSRPNSLAGASLGVTTAIVLSAAVMACGGPERTGQEPPFAEEWITGDEPLVSVGGHAPTAAESLDRVVGATRMADGRLAIANQGTTTVKLFGPDGAYLGEFGGEGSGPGEMRYIFSLARMEGDTLAVLSASPGLTSFDSDGQLIDAERRDLMSVPAHPCRHGEGTAWKPLAGGQLLRVLQDNLGLPGCAARPDGVWRMSALVGIPHDDGVRFDTIALMPGTERVGNNYRVFGHSLLVAPGTDRLYLGATDAGTILGVDYEGAVEVELPGPFPARPIPDELKLTDPFEYPIPGGGTRMSPGYTNYPDSFPRYGRLLVDSEQLLWVMEYPELSGPINSWRLAESFGEPPTVGPIRWRVLGRDGTPVAEVETPAAVFVLEIGQDYLLGLHRDEFGVESVRVYELTRGG